jgi:predicted ATP-dependent endonuclease of OLD family
MIRIEELHLENLQGFRELRSNLPPYLAVLIGVNSSGKSSILDSKSSILDSIAIFLSRFISIENQTCKQNSSLHLREDDIYINVTESQNSIRIRKE